MTPTTDLTLFATLCSKLESAIMQIVKKDDPDEGNLDLREIGLCLSRSLGISKLLSDNMYSETTIDQCVTVRKSIHRVMGGPGDWGYGTPIGDALKSIYNYSFSI